MDGSIDAQRSTLTHRLSEDHDDRGLYGAPLYPHLQHDTHKGDGKGMLSHSLLSVSSLFAWQGTNMWMDMQRQATAQRCYAILNNPSLLQTLMCEPWHIRWPIRGGACRVPAQNTHHQAQVRAHYVENSDTINL